MGSRYHYRIQTNDNCTWENWLFASSPHDFLAKVAEVGQRMFAAGGRYIVSVKLVKITD